MSDKVRVGIIGTSWWTEMMFLPSFKSHAGAEMAAICGRNRARAEELATQWGVAQVFTNYRALLKQGKLDAVVVATPDDLHYPMTMAAGFTQFRKLDFDEDIFNNHYEVRL